MTEENRFMKKRTGIIAFAIIASIILYLAGVFSGLNANKLVKEETQMNFNILRQETEKDLQNLKEKTEQDLAEMEDYLQFLDTNLKTLQLEETFTNTLTPEESCNFSQISLNSLVSQLGYYWDKLPFRLEEYEKNNILTDEYKRLKEQYTHLSIRIWILAKNQFDQCNTDIVHGLHFYSADCDDCIAQGEQIDELHSKVVSQGRDIIMFPIDFNSEDITIKNLIKFYSINATPALIINDKVYQGRLFKSAELLP